jgi:mRNA interferase ChpB
MRRGVPERGDVLYIDLEPTKGREQRGRRPVVVLTPFEFNHFGLVLVCPITQGGRFARSHGFAVRLTPAGKTQGIALCHQLRTLDYRERRSEWAERLADDVTEEILARSRTLLR